MQNSSKEELRKLISETMGWWAPNHITKGGKGFDAYPERTEKVVGLITQAFAAVRPEEKPTLGISKPSGSVVVTRRQAYNQALSDLDSNVRKYMEGR